MWMIKANFLNKNETKISLNINMCQDIEIKIKQKTIRRTKNI